MKGDMILEKNEPRIDYLDPNFKGPYLVIDVRGTSVKIRKGRKEKWIHISRCKQCRENGGTVSYGVPINNGDVHTEPQNEDAEDEKMSNIETENERELEGVEQPVSIGNSAQEVEQSTHYKTTKQRNIGIMM